MTSQASHVGVILGGGNQIPLLLSPAIALRVSTPRIAQRLPYESFSPTTQLRRDGVLSGRPREQPCQGGVSCGVLWAWTRAEGGLVIPMASGSKSVRSGAEGFPSKNRPKLFHYGNPSERHSCRTMRVLLPPWPDGGDFGTCSPCRVPVELLRLYQAASWLTIVKTPSR